MKVLMHHSQRAARSFVRGLEIRLKGAVVRAISLYLWDRGFDFRDSLWKESVNALPKVVGFLRVLRFPPTGKVDRVGQDKHS
jgi:hypothetical protein